MFEKKFQQQYVTNEDYDSKMCFPIGLYIADDDKSRLSDLSIHSVFDLLWNTIVLPQGANCQRILDQPSIQERIASGEFNKSDKVTSVELQLAQAYICDLTTFIDRRKPPCRKLIDRFNECNVADHGNEPMKEDNRGSSSGPPESVEGGSKNQSTETKFASSCLCCRTKEARDENKKLGYVTDHHQKSQPHAMRILYKDKEKEYSDMRKHTPFQWEVVKYTDILGTKLLNADVAEVASGFVLTIMTLFPDSDIRTAIDRYLNKPFDPIAADNTLQFVMSFFCRIRDFLGDDDKNTTHKRLPEWWKISENNLASASNRKWYIGLPRRCNLKTCPHGKDVCQLVMMKPLFLAWFKLKDKSLELLGKLDGLTDEIINLHCKQETKKETFAEKASKRIELSAMFQDAHGMFTKIVNEIQKSQSQYSLNWFNERPMRELREAVENTVMDHILHKEIVREKDLTTIAENLFREPARRFAWIIEQKISSLKFIATNEEDYPNKCFGDCGRCLHNSDDIECDWSGFNEWLLEAQRKHKKADKFYKEYEDFIKIQENSKRNHENKFNYGDKICKRRFTFKKEQLRQKLETCFGGCGELISDIRQLNDSIEHDWLKHLEFLSQEIMLGRLSKEIIKEEEHSREMHGSGNQICQTCFAEKRSRWDNRVMG